MRWLTHTVPVGAPERFTLAFAWTYFQERAGPDTGSNVRLLLPLGAIASGLALQEPVTVEVRSIESMGVPQALGLSWSPAGNALPSFEGTLRPVAAGEGRCVLTLSGSYNAPGGIAGAAFDALVGRRIAKATLVALLEQLSAAAEADYRTRSPAWSN